MILLFISPPPPLLNLSRNKERRGWQIRKKAPLPIPEENWSGDKRELVEGTSFATFFIPFITIYIIEILFRRFDLVLLAITEESFKILHVPFCRLWGRCVDQTILNCLNDYCMQCIISETKIK